MIENEYSRQEDSYKQQIADLEEEKEQLQVGISACSYTSLNGNLPVSTGKLYSNTGSSFEQKTLIAGFVSITLNDKEGRRERAWDRSFSTYCKG